MKTIKYICHECHNEYYGCDLIRHIVCPSCTAKYSIKENGRKL